MPGWLAAQRKRQAGSYDAAFERLKYNVRKVYPYAILAATVMRDVDSVLGSMYSKQAKSLYKERKESALNLRFKEELKDMTMDQGKILVKLINRQSGRSVYEVVKSLKGGLNAAMWQGVAVLFNNNLKNRYDPNGEDATIEYIVREIERTGHYEVIR
jgi:hypothetical protein